MTTDFRALCAELVQAFEDLRDSSHGVFGLHLNGDLAPWDELIEGGRFEDWLEVFARARAALADEPAVPQDREPATWTEGVCGDGAALLKDGVMVPIEAVVRELNEGARARAVLARWGNPAPQPVPVSERLPRSKDCDAEGRCWWFALETEVDFGAWTLGTPEACTGDNWGHTHWLPAHALPVPEVES